jgi:hypothetical protein
MTAPLAGVISAKPIGPMCIAYGPSTTLTVETFMKRYRVQPTGRKVRADDDGWIEPNLMDRSITVYETDPHWVSIGLLNADGDPIEAWVGMEPIGFVHFAENDE